MAPFIFGGLSRKEPLEENELLEFPFLFILSFWGSLRYKALVLVFMDTKLLDLGMVLAS